MSVKQEPDTVTEELTEPEPGCIRNVNTEHCGAPQVKTEDCFEEENSGLPNINQSQAQCLKLTKTEVDDVVNAVDGPSGLEDFCGYTDLLQKKVTSDLLDCLHKSNSLVTDFHPKCQYMLHPHDKEVHEHRTQTIVKSKDTENREFFVSQDVQNVDEYLSSSDEVFQSQQIKLYECGTCPYSSNYLFDLHKHNISHKMENVYICDLCQASYQYFLDLRYHLTSHVTGTESLSHLSVVIDQCTDKIQNFEDLNYVNEDMLMQNHADNIRTHGLEKSSDKCSLEQDVVLPKKRHVDNKQYSFDILLQNKCINKDFILNHSASDLNNAAGRMERGQETENELHREAVTSHFIDSALKRHNSDPWIHERTHASKKPYFCDKCDYKCAKPSRLYQHKKKHTGEKPYSCDQCDYKCAQLSNLNRHKKKHTGEKPYSCDLCDYKCAYLSKLTCHKKSHTGEKPYSCRLCDFRSASMYNCQIHERTHTGEKPYSCDQCDYKSAGSSNLYQHKRKHTSEKLLYSCDQCGYKCAQPSHLYQHKRNHTSEKPSYSCDKCDYKCARPSKLYQHKKKHTGEKPYSCDQCDYKCAQLSNLKRHKRRHTGEKPHSCHLCNYRCADSCDLRRHKKKHKQ